MSKLKNLTEHQINGELRRTFKRHKAAHLKTSGIPIFDTLSGELHETILENGQAVKYMRNVEVLEEWVARGYFKKENLCYLITDKGIDKALEFKISLTFVETLNLIGTIDFIKTLHFIGSLCSIASLVMPTQPK